MHKHVGKEITQQEYDNIFKKSKDGNKKNSRK